MKDFGHLWNDEFRKLWMDPTVTFCHLPNKLGFRGGSTLYFQAAEANGLPLDRGGIRVWKDGLNQYIRVTARAKKSIMESREVMKTLKKRIENLTASKAQKLSPSHYLRLFRRDYAWWSEFFQAPDRRRLKVVENIVFESYIILQ